VASWEGVNGRPPRPRGRNDTRSRGPRGYSPTAVGRGRVRRHRL